MRQGASPAIRAEQVVGQQRHVFEPLAQRRDVDPQHVEPVVEVLAEGALGDLLQQVPLGRGDDPHVGLDGRRAADPLEHLLLDRPEQLRLLLQGDVVDVVEVEGAAFGQVEAALAALVGAGERALLVAVEFAFDELRREERAADLDEGEARGGASCDG